MMNALRYLPTSTYFITVRLSSSFILLMIWVVFFADIISSKEILWFVLWVVAMLLLFERQWTPSKNIKLWLFYLVLWILFLVFGHTITKILSLELSQVPTLLVIAFTSAFTTALLFWYKHIEKNIKDIKQIFTINLFQSFFFFTYFYFLFQVYNLWDLGISYKIQSYSPFIPIILAAIIYREKISLKQSLWIFLTALSLYFFT
jgi:drug/metabolite transporter (DMT)-like permease